MKMIFFNNDTSVGKEKNSENSFASFLRRNVFNFLILLAKLKRVWSETSINVVNLVDP